MLRQTFLSVPAVWSLAPGAPEVRLPLGLLVGLLNGPGRQPPETLGALRAIETLFQRYQVEAARGVFESRVWAPSWPDAALRELIAGAQTGYRLFPELERTSSRAADLLGIPDTSSPQEISEYEIVTLGQVEMAGAAPGDAAIAVAGGLPSLVSAEALRDALVAARTRLLILHTESVLAPSPLVSPIEDLATNIVGGGGPAALVLASDSPAAVDAFLVELFAGIVHHIPLVEAAQRASDAADGRGGVSAHLVLGENAGHPFQFGPWMDALAQRAVVAQERSAEVADLIRELTERQYRRLHRSQTVRIENLGMEAESLRETREAVDRTLERLNTVHSTATWMHESEGVVPLSEISETLRRVEAAVDDVASRYPAVAAELGREEARAPRVLNANFADPEAGTVLGRSQGLIAEREYDLLVDVGPRWNRIQSLVEGSLVFPEEALPPEGDGYLVQAVVVSEDFSPQLASAEFWVPRGSGRSFPVNDGRPGPKPGPISLRLRAPALTESDGAAEATPDVLDARARLNLYFENNLLQSALVKVGVVRSADVALPELNTVLVDFALTGGFREVLEQFEARQVGVAGSSVALNLTMNDDGAGGHRFIVRRRLRSPDSIGLDPALGLLSPPSAATTETACPPQAWLPYDPQGNKRLLDRARSQLLACFYQKDANGNIVNDERGQPRLGLDSENGKSRDQFRRDLFNLAELGFRLFEVAFSQVRLDEFACNQAQWVQAIQQTLADISLIQVARTGPAQYVFPWALVYEIPLISAEFDEWTMCRIVSEEWGENGRRHTVSNRDRCPHEREPWHRKNVICPYGFWGLKHVIEQPPSVVLADGVPARTENVPRTIPMGDALDLVIAVTRDATLDLERLDGHVTNLSSLPRVRFQPPPADAWAAVRAMLRRPQLIYFLCHGEYDPQEDMPYLSIGPRDRAPQHRIYPTTVSAWARQQPPEGPDLDAWKQRRPLVIINGCHTSDLTPGEILSFVQAFSNIGASGVVGTEVSVVLPVAAEVGQSLLAKLIPSPGAEAVTLGESLRRVRWELADKGNLLGLAYTLYGLADLSLAPGN